ncbi:MAG: biopolymer transporter ExbD [Planctomycetia bacterium]|nr:biopolymer transporter ExbD [Planctomycetia bacterium]
MAKKREMEQVDSGDMTPMIDMVFQLLIFFMILINFADADQNQRVRLPKSELAKPPEMPIPNAITLQVAPQLNRANEFSVLIGADEITNLKELPAYLKREIEVVKRTKNKGVQDMTVIIRAHQRTKTGFVQEVIQVCQQNRLEKFALRAEQEQ